MDKDELVNFLASIGFLYDDSDKQVGDLLYLTKVDESMDQQIDAI